MEAQRDRARSARESSADSGWEGNVLSELSHLEPTQFEGYDNLESDAKVLAIIKDNGLVENAEVGSEISVILDKTPIYAESGGQLADKGFITDGKTKVVVTDCNKGLNGLFVHTAEVIEGTLEVNESVTISVDKDYRMSVARNHTATHILHKALKDILGSHVEQAGSLVGHDRLRFDFTHFEAMTKEQILEVENQVNAIAFSALDVKKEELSLKEAKDRGATALFGEKYGDTVRVVSIGGYSMELCGGTHLNSASEIGMFKIISETGVAAGVRRIEAVTGKALYQLMTKTGEKMKGIADLLKTNVFDIEQKISSLQADNKKLAKENESLKQKEATKGVGDLIENAKEINGMKVITVKFEGLDANALRNLGDTLKDKLDTAVIVLATVNGDSVNFISMATDSAIKKGAHAGNIVREVAKIAGGGGGGRPNMAQAGGKNPAKVDEALAKVYTLLEG